MHEYLVSICIPTYNFGQYIGETLEAICLQASPAVEVVVLDGGSTDNTSEVVGAFVRRIPGLRYYRQEWKGGIDRDIARTVELAGGEYCWLFSSDDIIRPGAIARVLKETLSGHDLYLLGRIECSPRMVPIRESAVLAIDSDAEFDLSDADDRARYFSLAENTYAFFSYMSSIVLRKTRWDQVPLDESYIGSCWAHVARIVAMIPDGLRLKYISEPLVLCRLGNDSFLSGSVGRRMGITVDGYNRIGAEFFGKGSREAFWIRRALRREHRLMNLLALKARAHRSGAPRELDLLDEQVQLLYDGPPASNRLCRLLYSIAPASLVDPVHRLYKALASAFGY